jgi:hypothetical protein
MAGALYAINLAIGGMFFGSVGERAIGLAALVGTGALVYFAVAWLIGGIDREAIAILLRRNRSAAP